MNAAGYFYDWRDFQATTQVNISGVPVVSLADAGDAGSAVWRPTSPGT